MPATSYFDDSGDLIIEIILWMFSNDGVYMDVRSFSLSRSSSPSTDFDFSIYDNSSRLQVLLKVKLQPVRKGILIFGSISVFADLIP